MGGGPETTRLDLLGREERAWNQTYWKAKIGYNMRWVAEGVFSTFKRIFGEHVMSLKWEPDISRHVPKVDRHPRVPPTQQSPRRCAPGPAPAPEPRRRAAVRMCGFNAIYRYTNK